MDIDLESVRSTACRQTLLSVTSLWSKWCWTCGLCGMSMSICSLENVYNPFLSLIFRHLSCHCFYFHCCILHFQFQPKTALYNKSDMVWIWFWTGEFLLAHHSVTLAQVHKITSSVTMILPVTGHNINHCNTWQKCGPINTSPLNGISQRLDKNNFGKKLILVHLSLKLCISFGLTYHIYFLQYMVKGYKVSISFSDVMTMLYHLFLLATFFTLHHNYGIIVNLLW